MKLADIGRAVTGIAYDSRAVKPGHVFVALKGARADGSTFARQAVESGAVAVVSEQPLADVGVPVLQVADARLALADRKSTRLNSSHIQKSRMPSSA